MPEFVKTMASVESSKGNQAVAEAPGVTAAVQERKPKITEKATMITSSGTYPLDPYTGNCSYTSHDTATGSKHVNPGDTGFKHSVRTGAVNIETKCVLLIALSSRMMHVLIESAQ